MGNCSLAKSSNTIICIDGQLQPYQNSNLCITHNSLEIFERIHKGKFHLIILLYPLLVCIIEKTTVIYTLYYSTTRNGWFVCYE